MPLWLELNDANDPGNGLLLFKPTEVDPWLSHYIQRCICNCYACGMQIHILARLLLGACLKALCLATACQIPSVHA